MVMMAMTDIIECQENMVHKSTHNKNKCTSKQRIDICLIITTAASSKIYRMECTKNNAQCSGINVQLRTTSTHNALMTKCATHMLHWSTSRQAKDMHGKQLSSRMQSDCIAYKANWLYREQNSLSNSSIGSQSCRLNSDRKIMKLSKFRACTNHHCCDSSNTALKRHQHAKYWSDHTFFN